MIAAALIALSFVAVAQAAVEADKVTTLPGFNGPLPSTHYSGYLPTGTLSKQKGQLHYWLIESTKNSTADPLVLWLNGGPGSSSLIGLLTENGQIQTNDNSLTNPINGIPQLFINEYAWSTQANVLYLESPKGVGFSYCEGVTSSSQCVNTDESTALDAYEFLVNFYAAYPEYKNRKFYITGESYAGIYIPMLMDQISKDVLGAKLPLAAAAIGNGCEGNKVGACSATGQSLSISSDFYYGHGMYSQELKTQIDAVCGDFSTVSAQCLKLYSQVSQETGNFDIYDVYDTCGNDERRRLSDSPKSSLLDIFNMRAESKKMVETADSFKLNPTNNAALNDYTCGGMTAMDVWLAEPSVIAALHVKANTVGMQYQSTADDLRPLYLDLTSKYPLIIYSGDVDACVPYVGSERWTRGLGLKVLNDWHSWSAKPDMTHASHKAGYAVSFANNFQFVTVNGAGHLVPATQPGFAIELLKKLLSGATF